MRIEKSLITIIIAFILTSCSGSVNYTNSSEPAKDNDEYFEFDTSQLEKFRFIEDAIENAVKYPPYYDNRVGNWHSYAGDKFENEPYYAEGYIVHNSEFPTTDIPSNIWVIENYQNNTDVLFALDFEIGRAHV